MKLNYKKYVEWKNSGGKKVVDFQFQTSTPHFANTMLSAVFLFFRLSFYKSQ